MAEEEADTLGEHGDDMPLASPDLEEPAAEASDEPADAGGAADDTVPDEVADEQPDAEGKPTPDEFKEPGFQKGYTKGTQKWAAKAKEAEARAAAAEAEREAVKAQLQLAQQQARAARPEPEQEDPPEVREHAARLEKLFQKTATFKQLQQERATLRAVMASKPEAFLEPDDVDADVVETIRPRLRQIVQQQAEVTPETIRIIAQSLAAPEQAKLIRQYKAKEQAAAKARSAKAAKMRQAQTGSSGGMGADGTVDLADADNDVLAQALNDPTLWKQELGQ